MHYNEVLLNFPAGGGAVMYYNEVLLNSLAGGGAVMHYNEVLLNSLAGGGAVMYCNEVFLNSPPLEGCPQGGVVVFRAFLAGYLNTSPSWLPEHPPTPSFTKRGSSYAL